MYVTNLASRDQEIEGVIEDYNIVHNDNVTDLDSVINKIEEI